MKPEIKFFTIKVKRIKDSLEVLWIVTKLLWKYRKENIEVENQENIFFVPVKPDVVLQSIEIYVRKPET